MTHYRKTITSKRKKRRTKRKSLNRLTLHHFIPLNLKEQSVIIFSDRNFELFIENTKKNIKYIIYNLASLKEKTGREKIIKHLKTTFYKPILLNRSPK